MTLFAKRLKEALAAASLPLGSLAGACGFTLAVLHSLERGDREPNADELDRVSLVFGIKPLDFLSGAAANGPATVLLRSASQAGRDSLASLLSLDWGQSIGEFLRCARDLRELEEQLGAVRAALPDWRHTLLENLTSARPQGEQLADATRERLGLGLEPLASVKELLESLGIAVLWTTPDEFAKAVDGASTIAPVPAVVVNLVGGSELFWRHRMTMAHELCHVLFDLAADGAQATVSPEVGTAGSRRPASRQNLFEGFDDLESRADAFAACLLAPSRGVRRVVAGVLPTSEEAVLRVGRQFGVGRLVAVNRLCDVFQLDATARSQLMACRPRWMAEEFEQDHAGQEEVGLRKGTLHQRAIAAFSRDLLDAVQVREYLHLSLCEPLEEPSLPPARRKAVVSVEDSLRRLALRHLASQGREHWHPVKVERVGEDWCVEIVDANEPTKVVQTLRLSAAGEVLEPRPGHEG